MSADHKRPLYAFIVLGVVCAVVFANAVRSQALFSVMATGVSTIVAGADFDPVEPLLETPGADRGAAPTVDVNHVTAAVGVHIERAAAVPAVASAASMADHPETSPASAQGHQDERGPRSQHGHHATAPGHAKSAGQPAQGHAYGHDKPRATDHGHGHGKAKGHDKAHHGPGKAKGHGK